MLHALWIYYAPEEVAAAVEHIDVLIARGTPQDDAVEDAARIYRARTGDYSTPCLRDHLRAQWRLRQRGGFGPLPGAPERGWKPKPGRYPAEVSLRAFLHRLLHE